MSYSFALKVENGEVTVEVSEGMKAYLPDGKFFIGGHEDAHSSNISISRVRPEGSAVVNANCGASVRVAESKS